MADKINTIGELIVAQFQVDTVDRLTERNATLEMLHWQTVGELSGTTGYSDLQGLCLAEGAEFNATWLETKLGEVAKSMGKLPSDVKLLTVVEFARLLLGGDDAADPPDDCYVTLLQMGGIVGRGKRTLRRLYDAGGLPLPAVEGGDGNSHEWLWSEVRPILEKKYRKTLPKTFPADRFIRS